MRKAEGRVPTRPTNNTDAASVPQPGDSPPRWRRVCIDRDPRGWWALYTWQVAP